MSTATLTPPINAGGNAVVPAGATSLLARTIDRNPDAQGAPQRRTKNGTVG